MINLVFFCELEHLVIGEKIGSLGLYIKYNGEGGRTSLTLSEVNPKFTDPSLRGEVNLGFTSVETVRGVLFNQVGRACEVNLVKKNTECSFNPMSTKRQEKWTETELAR